MENTKLTSVKVLKNLYTHFKVNTLNQEMTLQRFTNRCLYLYLQDNEFREQIDNIDELTISGSNF